MAWLLIPSAAIAQASPASPNWAAIRAAVQDSIVYIETLSRDADGANRDARSGTGIVVSTQGHVLTALHTIPPPYPEPERGRVRTITVAQKRHAQPIAAEIVRWDEQSDLVLLQVPRATNWRPLCFGDGAKVGVETVVWKLGYAGGEELSSHEGRISNLNGPNGKWHTTLALNRGDSGGPVFDQYGAIAGIASAGYEQQQLRTLVIPETLTRQLRQAVGILITSQCVPPLPPDRVRVLVGMGDGPDREFWAKPGKGNDESFHDCKPGCPEMVVIPAGSFKMGASPGEAGATPAELPQHAAQIPRPLAVGRFEVTYDQWDHCASDLACLPAESESYWRREGLPAVNISWQEAQKYVNWLSRLTRKKYRLPSESEWEYFARAGSTDPFWWGSTIHWSKTTYHCGGSFNNSPVCREEPGGPSRVGTFSANAWGIHDVHGNAREWVLDCWNPTYATAPSDAMPVLTGDCARRVSRGGSWHDDPVWLRSAARRSFSSDAQGSNWMQGLRVVREID